MEETENHIADESEAEIHRLKEELQRSKEHVTGLEDALKAMLFLLEDFNEQGLRIVNASTEWRATFDSISDLLFIHDHNLKIVRCNKSYQETAGMSFDEIIGRKYYEVFPKMEHPFKTCTKCSEETTPEEDEEEEEISIPSLNRIFNVKVFSIKDTEGKNPFSVHVMEDITEKKMAEERLHEEMTLSKHLLMIANAAAGTTDIDRIMEQVVQCLQHVMNCSLSLSYLWERERIAFTPCQAAGLSHDLVPFFRTETMDLTVPFIKKAIERTTPLVYHLRPQSGSPETGPVGVLRWVRDINTIVVIPIIGKEDYLGLLICLYAGQCVKSTSGSIAREMEIMNGLSQQVSIALSEARLYKNLTNKTIELSRKVETIQTMHEIDKSILSTLEPHEVLETAAMMLSRIIQCDRSTIVLVDREKGGFTFEAGFGITFLPKGAFVPFNNTSATDILKTGRLQYIPNTMEIRDILPFEENLLKDGFLSHIRIPLMVKGEITGVLDVGARRPSAFTPEDLSTIEKLTSRISIALQNAGLLADMEELFLGTVKTLSGTIDAKSPWTRGHSERVTKIALNIGKEMGMEEEKLRELELAGLLHDIGKLGTYEGILEKPGKLTEVEKEIIKQHPVKGVEILAPIKQMEKLIPIIKYHHESYDGTGYPDGLKGDEIPFMARILSVADTADAMGADRPYRKGKPMEAIIAEIRRCAGTQFDPAVANLFIKISGSIHA